MHLRCCSTFGNRETLACGSCFLRFPKVSQHPACMNHAILHGKSLTKRFPTFLVCILVRGRVLICELVPPPPPPPCHHVDTRTSHFHLLTQKIDCKTKYTLSHKFEPDEARCPDFMHPHSRSLTQTIHFHLT